jgi:Protein of unknown function (DUF3306)
MLSRWSKLKSEAKRSDGQDSPSQLLPDKAITAKGTVPVADTSANELGIELPPAEIPAAEAAPIELPPISELTKDSDYTPFMQAGVDPLQRNAAMRQLFKDPHYNIMDGLDTYIDDYSKPDPIPPEMLKRLVQSHLLNLFKSDEDSEAKLDPDLLDTAPRVNPSSDLEIAPESPKNP